MLKEYFAYLDDLRESGATNMYGASAYLEGTFGLSRAEGRKVLGQWMKTFGKGDTSPEERAALAEKEAA